MSQILAHASWICPSEDIGEVCPIFRKHFTARPGTTAKLEITALGVYEAFLNGQRIGGFFLAPGWTSYPTRLQVQACDLTALLRAENELTVTLGKGWFAGRISAGAYQALADSPRLLAALQLTDADGTREYATDESWQWAESPIRFSDIYDGETYDARVTPESWRFCRTDSCGKQMLIPQEGEIITEHERLKPVAVLHTPKGETVLDFGQEITGYAEFTVQARTGERIVLSCAEVLDADGNFYTENYRSARARMEYICRGGIQTGRAHHTFYGFRYLRVDEAPEGWQAENFTAICVYSDLQRTGWIHTSDPLLNQLYQNIVWGEKDNLLDVPTDCPQRDERLGWTGDAQVSVRAIAHTFDGKRFFAKWLRDMAAEQREDGAVSHFVPNVGLFTKDPALFCGGSAWADAAVICPWQLYQAYGDKTLLREHLPMMQKWVEYVRKAAGDGCIWNTGHQYGDWLALDAGEDNYTGASRKEFIATAFYAHSAQLLAQAMDALDMDGAAYRQLFETIRTTHQKTFPDCRTQTECALALHFGLTAEPERVAAQLAELVRRNGNRLTTGFVGTPYLLHALSENGYAQTAYDLLLQTEAPSWLFSVKMGATTVWEHWDSRKADGSFWSADMNSFNHHAYGAVADPAADAASDTEQPAASGEKKTVKIFQYKVEIADQLLALADEYMQLHPEINLVVESVDSTDYNTLLKTKFASGEAPDIFNNQGYTEFELWQSKLEDLSDQPWVSNMAEFTKEGISDADGKIYGLPLYLEGYQFCYNVKLFEKAGITELPRTLDELEAVCTQLEDAGIPAIINSLGSWYNMGVFGANVAVAHQPDIKAFIENVTNGTEKFETNEVFNEWVDLVDLMLRHTYKDPLTTSFSDQISRMANEEAAITLCNNGAWLSFMQINPDIEVGYFSIPINNDADYNDVLFAGVSTYWVVNNESESKQEAKEFLDWLTSSERGQYYLVQEFGFVSGLTSIPAPEEYVGPLSAAVAEAVAAGKTLGWEWPRYPAGMTEEFGVGIQKYASGACTKEQMLEGFTQSWKNLAG